MRTTITLLFTAFSLMLYSQTTIFGKVVDADNKSIPDVTVTMLSVQDSAVLAFAMTDADGNYSIQIKSEQQELLISIFSFDIERQTKRIGNKTQTVNFTAKEGSVVLEDVIVKSRKVWGEKDTINYLVSAFKDKKDVVIGDVLKKMPGITVSESGQISYQGKPINKFYIENMDMLGGKYGITTNNVAADDVSTVQVLENHQPIKALETTTISTEAAINLKIKEDKKGIFNSRMLTGLGYDTKLLWHGELMGMYFGKGYQNITTYKADNSGENIGQELSYFNSAGGLRGMQMTSLTQPTSPGINLKRYFFNNSHGASLNNLKKLKNGSDIIYNLAFYNNQSKQRGYSRIDYNFLGDSILTITEDISTGNRINQLDGELRYDLNKANNYVNNTFYLKSSWIDASGKILTDTSVDESFKNIYFSASNFTQWIKKWNETRGFQLTSINGIMKQPHYLSITPGLYSDIFNKTISYNSLKQKIDVYGFSSTNTFSLLSALSLGKFRFNPNVGLDLQQYGLNSSFDITDNNDKASQLSDIDFRNDIRITQMSASAGLNIDYSFDDLKINIELPCRFTHTIISNVLKQDKPYLRDRFYLQPSVYVKYSLSSFWDMNAKYNLGKYTPGLSSLYTGYILSDYKKLQRYETYLFDNYSHNGTFNVSYKNLMSMLFLTFNSVIRLEKSDFSYGESVVGKLFVKQLKEIPTHQYTYSISGSISKGFDWKSLNISFASGWSTGEGTFLRQNQLIASKYHNIMFEGTVYLKLFKWLIADNSTRWSQGKSTIITTKTTMPVIRSMKNKIALTALLPYDIGLNVSYENYYNNRLAINKNIAFADAGLSYVRGGTRYSLEWTNILNTKKYVYAFSGIDTYYSEYYIRPTAVMFKVQFKIK